MMKKIFLIFFSVFFLFLLSISSIRAAEDCETIFGGTCKVICGSDERALGNIYCKQPREVSKTCCLAQDEPVLKKSCGESCMGAAECPPECQACQELVRGQGKICRDCPITGCQITPAPGPGGGEAGSIRTAIGDIDPTNLQGFIQQLLNLALGVAGGIAFLLMLFGAFRIMTSAGDPEKMKSGSELITSALTGLLFIILSVFLLKLIGVDILDIPGFGSP